LHSFLRLQQVFEMFVLGPGLVWTKTVALHRRREKRED